MTTPDVDVIVIGAGPAGMSAAIELASVQCSVIVFDMQPAPGGQVFRDLEDNNKARPMTDDLLAALGSTYNAGRALIQKFRDTPCIDYRPLTTIWDLRADGTVGWLKGDNAGYLRARHVVLANGAMERPTPFPGWTLPGVMTAGAVQTLIKAGRLQPQGKVVLAGTGPLIFLLADQLQRLGIRPAMIARTDRLQNKIAALSQLRLSAIPTLLKGLGWLLQIRLAGIPMRTAITNLKALGVKKIDSVGMTVGGRDVVLPCDLLIVHDGVVPSIDLAHCAGLALEWQEADQSWRPKTSHDGRPQMAPGPTLTSGPCRIRITGDARTIGGAEAAIVHGHHTAKAILAELDVVSSASPKVTTQPTEAAVSRSLAARPFIDSAFPLGLAAQLPDDPTIVCRCEEINAGSLRASIREGITDMNAIRGLLRCGMGPCQGRNCSVTLARLLAETKSQPPTIPVPFRARPPLRPLPLLALANLTGLNPELAQVLSLDDKPHVVAGEEPHA
jgi:NADPH-dependent 2,4-dienoyl-CoA reductase/sulfur reductase-like enzyme/bacterioferritin-associated ferredoxin